MDAKTSLLIVEDESLIALQVKRSLELRGYHVYEPVTTGQAAIDNAAAHQPDIILMDIRLRGEMDGIQAAQEILARHDIPIIFMTGYSDPEIAARAQAVNPVAILEKPLLPHQIADAIASAVRRKA